MITMIFLGGNADKFSNYKRKLSTQNRVEDHSYRRAKGEPSLLKIINRSGLIGQNIEHFSSPEQTLRVSYCHHPLSIVRRSSSTISLLTL